MKEFKEQIFVCVELLLSILLLTFIYVASLWAFLGIINIPIKDSYPWLVFVVISVLSVAYLFSILILWRCNIELQKTRRAEINANK